MKQLLILITTAVVLTGCAGMGYETSGASGMGSRASFDNAALYYGI
jgi:uncharacterized protein YceK